MAKRSPRVYGHRLREQVILTGNPDLFPELDIPRRTALSWIRRGCRDVVTLEDEAWAPAYHVRIAKLERRVAMLSAVLRLVLTLLRISGFELERSRVPDAMNKRRLLSAIERARKAMPLSAALRVLQLSSSRYHAWVRADDACALDDRPSCPRSNVQRLTYDEVQAIGDMVQSATHRHMSIRGLALHAQRIGKVFAHPATWGKLIRDRGWRRSRFRLYPAKPKVGLRTQAPNDAWHVDVSVLKLLDGTKADLHAVIDNFSRRILAWTVDDHLDPMNTHAVLQKAAKQLTATVSADVVMDSGVENLNGPSTSCSTPPHCDASSHRSTSASRTRSSKLGGVCSSINGCTCTRSTATRVAYKSGWVVRSVRSARWRSSTSGNFANLPAGTFASGTPQPPCAPERRSGLDSTSPDSTTLGAA